jgi:S-adenosylmethionine:tRNA ribosyltransferase-isomerase
MSYLPHQSVSIDNYNYILPEASIARFPLENPAGSRLLVYNKGDISHTGFESIVDHISREEMMIFNNTKVIQARIIMVKPNGAEIEIFLLEPVNPPEYSLSFSSTSSCYWKCMTGNKKRWKSGRLEKEFVLNGKNLKFFAEITNDQGSWQEIKFSWEPKDCPFLQVIETIGLTPIPPYLNRAPEQIDRERYQTVYSRFEGSVAAPTAGLHFTDDILSRLRDKGTLNCELTLHVGAGTFQPVRSKTIDLHQMHSEQFSVSIETLEKIILNQDNITAVGTTSARALETIYWLGVKQLSGTDPADQEFSQWEAYDLPSGIPVTAALNALLHRLSKNKLNRLTARTSLMIVPGYNFRLTGKLLTNFHQPRSTLLLLIAAFIGDDWRRVYQHALSNDFRFLSYGDSSLLIPCKKHISG